MYSRSHAVVSALLGVPIALGGSELRLSVLLWLYVVALGVGIDVDHFIIGRLNRGDWRNLHSVLRCPTAALVDQPSLFDGGDVWRDQRLFSHLLLGGLLTAGFWSVSYYWALATAVTVYVHLLCDLYSDVRTRDTYLRNSVSGAHSSERPER